MKLIKGFIEPKQGLDYNLKLDIRERKKLGLKPSPNYEKLNELKLSIGLTKLNSTNNNSKACSCGRVHMNKLYCQFKNLSFVQSSGWA